VVHLLLHSHLLSCNELQFTEGFFFLYTSGLVLYVSILPLTSTYSNFSTYFKANPPNPSRLSTSSELKELPFFSHSNVLFPLLKHSSSHLVIFSAFVCGSRLWEREPNHSFYNWPQHAQHLVPSRYSMCVCYHNALWTNSPWRWIIVTLGVEKVPAHKVLTQWIVIFIKQYTCFFLSIWEMFKEHLLS
jgi:hypothetical protein